MLFSELEERERRFKLALRAGIPILLLVSLIYYVTVFREGLIFIDVETSILLAAIVFATVYFIYFLMEIAITESLTDQITQGFTQQSFIKRLEKFKPKTLVLLVINNLSTLNEFHQSDKVDRMLYEMVHTLDRYLKGHGFKRVLIARRYGAEFLIALDMDDGRIEPILHQFITQHKHFTDMELDLRFSLITNITNNMQQNISLLKDLLHIQSKSNPFATFDIDLKDARKVASIESSICHAVEQEALSLMFRPIRHAQTQQIDLYEISVRLYDQNGGVIQPKVFLPIVNRLGLGVAYDLALTKHLLSILPLVDDSVSFSFNLSPFSLRNQAFGEGFFKMLEQSNILPNRLIIELYERKVHHDLSSYFQVLRRYRSRGIRIAIDNFGSSNASMEYIKHFHFDFIQFDRDYVTQLDDIQTKAMLNSLIQMAKELEIKTIAKWVDKTEQKRELITMGIDYLQGYGIAKPMNENELLQHYNSQG